MSAVASPAQVLPDSAGACDPSSAQDVYKDVGRSVNFSVLNLARKDQTGERALIEEFCDRSQSIIRSLRIRNDDGDLLVAIGFSNSAWDYLFPGAPKPKELQDFTGLSGGRYDMPATGGDIFLHVRAASEALVYECVTQFMEFLRPIVTVQEETHGFRYLEGRAIIGFIDGTEAPSPADSPFWAIVGDEDPEFSGGSYSFLQKWIHDMDKWTALGTEEQERAVGRRKYSDIELAEDQKSQHPAAHNVASKLTIDGVEKKIIRMNVPFSYPTENITGTMFIGYARHWEITKSMLEQMLAKTDYLLTFSQIKTGQLFFIPSRDLLAKMAAGEFGTNAPPEADIEIKLNPA
ncbi:MAG: Dyp-type peroxidase [Promicromonosporaceae bacterium]|nr:Dyp-type peroxidase [Promicromonosporaceae bacterium]